MLKIIDSIVSYLVIAAMFLGLYNPAVAPYVPPESCIVYDLETFPLVENGQSGYVIVRGANAIPAEVTAANKLQGFLKEISGVELAVVTDEAAAQEKEIVVGDTNRYAVDYDPLGEEGFVLKTIGSKVIIAGGKPRGTLYGIYDFLEKFAGCHWYSKETKIIPEMAALEIPAAIDELEIPVFLSRAATTVQQGYDVDSALANRINDGWVVPDELRTEAYGGLFGWIIGHDVDALVSVAAQANGQIEAHPEYFAKDENGVPYIGYTNPCLTNPVTIQAYADYAASRIDAGVKCISLGMNDNDNICHCAGCTAMYAEESTGAANLDGFSGTYVRFLNAICEILEAKGGKYAEATISGFGYGITEEPPKTACHENILIYFCPISMCYAHKAGECSDENTRRLFEKNFLGWSAKCEAMAVFEYPLTYNLWNTPYPLWSNIQSYLQLYRDNKVLGLINCSSATDDVAFYQMTGCLYARLLWNPNADMEALYASFLPCYYGEGWQYIREYIRITGDELTGRTIVGTTFHTYCLNGATTVGSLCMTNNQIKYIDALWAKAKELTAAGGQAQQLINLRRAELSWRTWKSDNFRGEFSPFNIPGSRRESNTALFHDTLALGIVQHSEGAVNVSAEDFEKLDMNVLSPQFWSWRRLGRDNEGQVENVWEMLWGWIF